MAEDDENPEEEREARRSRAHRLQAKIEDIIAAARKRSGATPRDEEPAERGDSPASPSSPREFIHRKMAERARKKSEESS